MLGAPPASARLHPTAPITPAVVAAELDPTVIFGFPAAPIQVEPGGTWQLPVWLNASVGGRPTSLQRQVGGRWVTVGRTRARGVRLAFPVREPRAGTFRYRLVVPVHGGFEARTSKVQVVTVAPIDAQTRQHFIPTTISGTFSGYDITWGVRTMSWSGSMTFTHVPYVRAGLTERAYYRPSAMSMTWVVDYVDFRQCHFTGTGTLGLPDAKFGDIAGVPDESVAPGAAASEYEFDLIHQWDDPHLLGWVQCPGAAAEPHDYSTAMGHLLSTDRQSFGFQPNLRLAYVDGLPLDGWVRMVGTTDPADPSSGSVVNSWDLTGSGRTSYIRPVR
jgi:hypothetical protein